MRDQGDHIELIERYLSEKMSPDEKLVFEGRLLKEVPLKDSYENYLETISAIKTYHFKKEVSEVHREYMVTENKRQNSWRYISGIAASIAVIVASVYLFLPNEKTNQELFQSYFEPYPNLIKIRGGEGYLSKAMERYSSKNYDLAIPLFNHVIENSSDTDRLNLYLAVSYMGIKNYEMASEQLQKISSNSIYTEQATWYLALTYVAEDDKQRAIHYLKKISPSAYKYEEAQKLLSLL